MPHLKLISLAFLFLFCLAAPRAEAAKIGFESFTLENGLRVVVIPNHRAPVVTHMIWYLVGGADEPAGKSGIAHFLEHLMFKGTPNVPDGAFSRTVKKLGGNDNAFTSHDYTAYYQNIAREHLPTVMEMEADRMKNLILKESEVVSEREVIIEERRQRIDNQPQARFQEQMMSTLFVNHPYGVPVIGWLHEMKELTREDAFEKYRLWYAPNNAILIVAGDVTAQQLKPLAEKYYGSLAPSETPKRIRPRPAPIVADHRLVMEDPRIGMPLLTKAFRAPRGDDALEIFAEVFGGGSTARLYKSLVVEQKIAVSAGVDYNPVMLNDTSLTIYASPAAGVSMAQMEMAVLKEISKIMDKGITLEELKSAQGKKKTGLTYYLDSLQGPALLLGRVLASGFDPDYIENWDERIDKLTIDDVNKATKRLFAPDNIPVTGLLLPAPQKQGGTAK